MINNLKLGKAFFVVFSVCVFGSIESVEGNLPQNKSNAYDEEIWSGYTGEDMTLDEYGVLRGLHPDFCEKSGEIRWHGGKSSKEQYLHKVIEHKYVGFGDSLTWGWTVDYWGSIGGYGPHLQEMLTTVDVGVVVVLRGRGGERTGNGVERIDSVLEEEEPEYILILEGTNDIQANIARSEIAYNLAVMVRKAQEYGSIPVLGTLPPRRDTYYMSDWSEDLNRDYIRPFAQQEKVLLADHWKFFNETDDWTEYVGENDQHPNTAGYKLMAESWFVALEEDSPPTGLTAAVEKQTVRLMWDASNDEFGFEGYNVYRKSPIWNQYERLNDELINEIAYEDTGLSSEYYVYAVTAVDKCGNEGDYSSEVAVDLSSGDGGCFIATAAYGTPMSEEVRVLCRFRDEFLLTRNFGRILVRLYYGLSSPVARFISEKNFIRAIIRAHLKPVIRVVKSLLKCEGSNEP